MCISRYAHYNRQLIVLKMVFKKIELILDLVLHNYTWTIYAKL